MDVTNKPVNPFYTGIHIPDDYFCDRRKETEIIVGLILNGNNVVLKANRRIGKSSLIYHIFNRDEIKNNYNTLYLDLLGTKSLVDFHAAFQNKLFNAPFAKSARIRKDFEMLIKNLSISLGEYNPATGNYSLPRIGTTPSQMPLVSMDELFDFLERTKKPNLVVFDEFQQIQYYPERMAAILRSYIQKANNTRFIFSGSSPHMLTEMFQMGSQPFYKSAETYEIKVLDKEVYADFCKTLFEEYHKTVSAKAMDFLYTLLSGETAPMQEVMNQVFRRLPGNNTADIQSVKDAIYELLDNRDTSYREILNRIERDNTRNTLFCIAAMGIASGLTSSKTMRDYKLESAASVQKSLIALLDEKSHLIRKIAKGTYVMDDRLFELWIAREGGYLEDKYRVAPERFLKQLDIENPIFNPTRPKQ